MNLQRAARGAGGATPEMNERLQLLDPLRLLPQSNAGAAREQTASDAGAFAQLLGDLIMPSGPRAGSEAMIQDNAANGADAQADPLSTLTTLANLPVQNPPLPEAKNLDATAIASLLGQMQMRPAIGVAPCSSMSASLVAAPDPSPASTDPIRNGQPQSVALAATTTLPRDLPAAATTATLPESAAQVEPRLQTSRLNTDYRAYEHAAPDSDKLDVTATTSSLGQIQARPAITVAPALQQAPDNTAPSTNRMRIWQPQTVVLTNSTTSPTDLPAEASSAPVSARQNPMTLNAAIAAPSFPASVPASLQDTSEYSDAVKTPLIASEPVGAPMGEKVTTGTAEHESSPDRPTDGPQVPALLQPAPLVLSVPLIVPQLHVAAPISTDSPDTGNPPPPAAEPMLAQPLVERLTNNDEAKVMMNLAPATDDPSSNALDRGIARLSEFSNKNEYKQILENKVVNRNSDAAEPSTGRPASADIAPSSGPQKLAQHAVFDSDSKPVAHPRSATAATPYTQPVIARESKPALETMTTTTVAAVATTASLHARPFATEYHVDQLGEITVVASTTPAQTLSSNAVTQNIGIAPSMGTPEWKPAFTGSIQMLLNNGATGATLQINPAELGPIEVRIHMVDQRADISFAVSNRDAGAAIQSALPDLREQLGSGGIQLGHTSVGDNGHNARHAPDAPRNAAAHAAGAENVSIELPQPRPSQSSNQIDLYA